jgi:hypothetical protein
MAAAIDLVELHAGSRRNRSSLAKAAVCGCFYCLSDYQFERITAWTDDDETALCPVCGIDAVLGFSSQPADRGLLEKMHDRWFKTSQRLTQEEWMQGLKKDAWENQK